MGRLDTSIGEGQVAIAIPAHDEADRIASCLAALVAQTDAPVPLVLLLVNNTRDETVAIARAHDCARLRVEIVERTLPPHRANAGTARALALAHAVRRVGPDGIVLTTDADAVPPPRWLAANLAALAAADAVTGRAVIDPDEALLIPAALHEADARECAYATLLDEIAALVDPDPADPWPRHDEASGASIAVHAETYVRAGGMPMVPLGEDRAFIAALRRIDARVRHAPEVWVTVSGRTVGRARGGMADTMLRRLTQPDLFLDDRLEAADAALRRAGLRRLARAVHAGLSDVETLARALQRPEPEVRTLQAGTFGAGWAALEAESPLLRRAPVRVSDLAAETARAREIRDALLIARPGDPADIVLGALA